ncbi:DUF2493 domain-containing protein [Exiguobacterium sp. SH5S4]|uniref:DUF2493 domain-containing protein n=1 Tax=Exiguobacterium sp. SH5S4 TaxID=2510961 RepID=UPI00103AC195|nr:DUF2493 domain-containing protein [Exiguobacterium sp. SH5S4]TCI26711.1 DUF2493 domain-containing protein [Exiguobacterium sp. SH5S4]
MEKFKVVVAGGREFDDYELLKKSISGILRGRFKRSEVEIVSGAARGADVLGERFAKDMRCSVKRFPANWDIGKQAGYIRNSEMADYGDMLIAFWDQQSRGTMHMINLAKKKGLEVHVVHYET